MLLAIDIGNTNVTLGVYDGRSWRRQWRVQTVREKTADEYGIVLKSLLYEDGLDTAVAHIILASVVPSLTTTISRACQQYLGRTPLEVGLNLDVGIRVITDNPAEVGVDRIVNAVAAYGLHPGPSIVVDMGTATKFDAVSANGELIGGVIAPGLQLTADALTRRAAKLGQVALEAPPQTIGRNTVHAIQSGLIYGYVSLCEGIVARLKAEHPDREQPIRVLGTGGLIPLIADHTPSIDFVDPWLTLTGLRFIHERAKGVTR
ncbi:MAG: type III pantothenate kinase [Chloroflexi bacterium]|nr:type III pantothenate kinase [Chloroflexota bacterium]